jgi:hypothetical protein
MIFENMQGLLLREKKALFAATEEKAPLSMETSHPLLCHSLDLLIGPHFCQVMSSCSIPKLLD